MAGKRQAGQRATYGVAFGMAARREARLQKHGVVLGFIQLAPRLVGQRNLGKDALETHGQWERMHGPFDERDERVLASGSRSMPTSIGVVLDAQLQRRLHLELFISKVDAHICRLGRGDALQAEADEARRNGREMRRRTERIHEARGLRIDRSTTAGATKRNHTRYR